MLHGKHRLSALTALFTILVGTLALQSVTLGQQSPTAIRIEAGETFEVGAQTNIQNPIYSWILTQDRVFKGATRSKFYQSRQTVPGTYTLDLSITNDGNTQTEFHSITLTVTEPTGMLPTPGSRDGAMMPLLRASPLDAAGNIALAPTGGFVRLDPSGSQGRIARYEIDVDSTVDSDGDGNVSNDRDTVDSISETSGSPLYYMLLPKNQNRSVVLHTVEEGTNQQAMATKTVLFNGQGIDSGVVSGSLIGAEKEGLTVVFGARLTPDMVGDKQLLLEWEFGDGNRSLLNRPTHTYNESGTFTVTLVVRDLETGLDIIRGTEAVSVEGTSTATSSVAASEPSEVTTPSTFSVWSIVKAILIIIVLLALAIGLFFIFRILKRKATGSLQKTLETMEQKIVETEPKPAAEEPAPMKLKKDDAPKPAPTAAPPAPKVTIDKTQTAISDRELEKKDFKSAAERDTTAPAPAPAPVPDWLKKAPAQAAAPAEKVEQTPAPQPKPEQPKPQPAAAPTPAPTPPPQPKPAPTSAEPKPQAPVAALQPTPAPTAPVPDWLKPKAAPTPAAAPQPKPEPKPEPKIEQPKPVPAPTPAAVLKPEPPKPAPAPQPVPAPATTPQPAPAPKVEQAPVPQPKPAEPKPQLAPAPAPTPALEPKPAPVEAKPAQPIVMDIPRADTPVQKKDEPKNEDPPIAIIQADSISK